jgi:hypothetical protein
MHGVRIRVSDDVKRFTRDMDEAANRQIPFALARALTRTAQDAQSEVRSDLPRRFKDTTAETVRRRFGVNFVASLSGAMGHRG